MRRAVPLSLEVLLGFCGFHVLFGRWHQVGASYVWFLCLLHTGEILTLEAGHVTLSVDSGVLVLALPASKGAKLMNAGGSVVVSDPTAGTLLAFLFRGCSAHDRVFQLPSKDCHPRSSQQQQLLVSGLQACCLTISGEAGLLFHFAHFGSIDLTTHYGRWTLATAARNYIPQAECDAVRQVTGMRQPGRAPTLHNPHGLRGGLGGGGRGGRLGDFSTLTSFMISLVSAQGPNSPSRLAFSCRRQVDEGLTLRWEEALVGSWHCRVYVY